jgi:phosphoribosylaminoimidazole carboxylase (NCAIR synthetase)
MKRIFKIFNKKQIKSAGIPVEKYVVISARENCRNCGAPLDRYNTIIQDHECRYCGTLQKVVYEEQEAKRINMDWKKYLMIGLELLVIGCAIPIVLKRYKSTN